MLIWELIIQRFEMDTDVMGIEVDTNDLMSLMDKAAQITTARVRKSAAFADWDEWFTTFDKAFKKAYSEFLDNPPDRPQPLLTEKEAAERLSVNPGVLKRDRANERSGGEIKVPYFKLPSGGVRYHSDDIQRAMEDSCEE